MTIRMMKEIETKRTDVLENDRRASVDALPSPSICKWTCLLSGEKPATRAVFRIDKHVCCYPVAWSPSLRRWGDRRLGRPPARREDRLLTPCSSVHVPSWAKFGWYSLGAIFRIRARLASDSCLSVWRTMCCGSRFFRQAGAHELELHRM